MTYKSYNQAAQKLDNTLIGTGTTVDTFSIYGASDERYQVIRGNQQVCRNDWQSDWQT